MFCRNLTQNENVHYTVEYIVERPIYTTQI